MKKLLVTGSNGLIGSAMVGHFHKLGWEVYGVDNNMRADFFGPGGDTRWNQERLLLQFPRFTHHELDMRNRSDVIALVEKLTPDAVIHTAAQPSHDLAAMRPFDDFDVNTVGTFNLLEAMHRFCPESPLVHLSTNKVYGDAPNTIKLRELPSRWDSLLIRNPAAHQTANQEDLNASVALGVVTNFGGRRKLCCSHGAGSPPPRAWQSQEALGMGKDKV